MQVMKNHGVSKPTDQDTVTMSTTLPFAAPGLFTCVAIDHKTANVARLHSLGVCVGRSIELISVGDPLIVRVCGSSIGISRQLASAITVQPQAGSERAGSEQAGTERAGTKAESDHQRPLLANV